MIPWRYDMTAARLFTLSDQTVRLLAGLEESVYIAAVYPAGAEDMMVSSLLEEYAKAGARIMIEHIDADREPARLASYNLGLPSVPNNSVIIQCGNQARLLRGSEFYEVTVDGLMFSGERRITGMIRFLTVGEMPVMYVAQGRGETSWDRISQALTMLQNDAYDIRPLNLTQSGAVPSDSDVLAFVSPKQDLTDQELGILREYIGDGGSLLLMIDAVLNSNDVIMPNFTELCGDFGVDIRNNIVIEDNPSYYLSSNRMYLIPDFTSHPITQNIQEQRKLVVLPVVRGLARGEHDSSAVQLQPLLVSSQHSWARVDVTVEDPGFTDTDVPGPVPMAFAAVISNYRHGGSAARVVVIGNASFAYDGNIEVQANSDLWVNTITWLTGDRDVEAIAAKAIGASRLVIRGDDFMKLSIICLLVIPLVAFGSAIATWATRRNR